MTFRPWSFLQADPPPIQIHPLMPYLPPFISMTLSLCCFHFFLLCVSLFLHLFVCFFVSFLASLFFYLWRFKAISFLPLKYFKWMAFWKLYSSLLPSWRIRTRAITTTIIIKRAKVNNHSVSIPFWQLRQLPPFDAMRIIVLGFPFPYYSTPHRDRILNWSNWICFWTVCASYVYHPELVIFMMNESNYPDEYRNKNNPKVP